MVKKSISSFIIDKFGLNLYQKSLRFLTNKINIIDVEEDPINIRSIILDNEREFHLIIDEKNNEIFHDCPSFLIHPEREKKICVHLIKFLLVIKSSIAQNILENLKSYTLTSEDIGSHKKRKNFLLLANSCFDNNNCVEALSYLNKAIFNQFDSEDIIKTYLNTAIDNNLFIEFFEFLKNGYENELETYILKFNSNIEKGFIKFLNSISEYSFFDLLKIIESMDKMFEFKKISFLASEFDKLNKLVKSPNFNNNYFSIYLIKRNYNEFINLNPKFTEIFSQVQLESLKSKLINYFFSEIDNFCVIDKLKLLKKQFQVINIPKKTFYDEYKRYKKEIQELEKKVYLKKFSFLKLLMEKYNIIKTKGEFRKKRNTYIVKHSEDNLKNPVYNYIISRIGFFGLNEQTIKSSEIGINYYIMKELFLDDISSFQDVFYYRQQFWGEMEDYEIKSIDGLSLSSEIIEYSYDIDYKYSDDLMIIEWDLAHKPFQGSIVNAYGSQIIIPDYNNPLFHDLKPFDLCYCKKTPVKIESKIIKTINVIKKCSFKDAIKSVSKSMEFIEGYYPLSLVRAVLNREIDPFHANEIVFHNPNKLFVPNYNAFIKAFNEFLLNYIFKEKDYIFEELKNDIVPNTNQILTLLNLNNELSGLDLPYTEILKRNIYPDIALKEFKSRFLNEIHSIVKNILNQRKFGSTIIFDLKKMKHTPFFKYSNEILDIRKEEFESSEVFRFYDKDEVLYDMTESIKTYYGKKFLEILHKEKKLILKPEEFKKFHDFSSKLNLKLKIVNKNN
ncbi:MAG: hypothetical protein KAW51_07730 [Candidatus Lokiarchaeota archaeon]|nr:hypothetical protein [Candidatus Lokiarchaeota archaeon]